MNLTCIVNQSAAPPRFIYWQLENKVLNFADSNPHKLKISDNLDQLRPFSSNPDDQLNNELTANHFHVHTHNAPAHYQSTYQTVDPNQPFISQLLIYNFNALDAGNYSCRSIPQYSEAANVTVNLLNEENQLFFSNHYYSNQLRNLSLNWLSLLFVQLIVIAINCNKFLFNFTWYGCKKMKDHLMRNKFSHTSIQSCAIISSMPFLYLNDFAFCCCKVLLFNKLCKYRWLII